MQVNAYAGVQGALRREEKTNWTQKQLTADMLFIHGGPMTPSQVRQSGGLNAVQFGQEWVVAPNDATIGGGKLIFSFLVVAGNQPPANFPKPAGVRRLWGEAGHCYIFLAPLGTYFWSSGADQPVIGAETAFEYLIELADLTHYCTPSTRTHLVGQLPRSTYSMVPWNVVVAAQTAP